MATITTAVYLDDASRSAGETMTINSGGSLTVRTDTRWHANSPASMTGTLGALTINNGSIIYDGENVRWLAFTNAGSSNVPAIGTNITQAGVSASYLLGVWATLNSEPTLVGSAIPASGFLKFRSVTGAFTSGLLTGIGSSNVSATGPDVLGWIEGVCDSAIDVTVARLGTFQTKGGWFYLDNTNGSIAQVIQTPTNGGGAGTAGVGLWIEASAPRASTYTWAGGVVTVTLSAHGYIVGQAVEMAFSTGGATAYAGEYKVLAVQSSSVFTLTLAGSGSSGNCTVTTFEFWPGLNGSTNGWAKQHIGAALGGTDSRQNFVKDLGTGQLQIGEASSVASTYATATAQASTYASIAYSATYTWASDLVTVNYASGHLLNDGMSCHLDFTSGGATAYDGQFTITVLDAYNFTVPLSGSGAAGNVTLRPGHTITFTAHAKFPGADAYFDFTSGAGVDGVYSIYAKTGANTYLIAAPHATTTSGNVSVTQIVTVTMTAHGLALGNRVYLDFTSGSGVDGTFTIAAVATDTFNVVYPFADATAISGNVNVNQTLGNIPASGCRTRIPNVFLREAATGTRATNLVNSTQASRPEFVTTSAGSINIAYASSTWYHNFSQAYLTKHWRSALLDLMVISENATAIDLYDMGLGMWAARDNPCLTLTSCFAGGTIEKVKFMRGNAPGTTDHSFTASYCIGQIFKFMHSGIIQFVRSTGAAINLSQCNGITFNDCYLYNAAVVLTTCLHIYLNRTRYSDRVIGRSNATTGQYVFTLTTFCDDIAIDGIMFGVPGMIIGCHPLNGIITSTACSNVTVRNAGTFAAPLDCANFRVSDYGPAYIFLTGGNNNTLLFQRIYLDRVRTGMISTVNSDKNVRYESLMTGMYAETGRTINTLTDAGLNSYVKGCIGPVNATTGNTSVYGTHFQDLLAQGRGRFVLMMNEPTAETVSMFTIAAGTPKFNSAGGVLMAVIGDQAIWEDSVFRKGHTGFVNTAPIMSGGTIGNYTLEYQVDTGSGYGGSWVSMTGGNLSGISVDPVTGFRMKIRITTSSTNTTAITFLMLQTTTSSSAQTLGLYPLATCPITVTAKNISTGAVIQSVRVLILADTGGLLPSGASVSITRSGSTATVAHTAHGMSSTDRVQILGATQPEYNGIYVIIVTGVDSYTYTVSGTPASPATGTPQATAVLLSDVTNVSGVATSSVSLLQVQPVMGRLRLATGSFFKTALITGSVHPVTGLTSTIYLIPDA